MAPDAGRDVSRILEAARLLREAERPVRVLRTVAWSPQVRERFFAAGERELPEVRYQPIDPTETLALVEVARQLTDADDVVDEALRRAGRAIELGARMLAAVGTPELFRLSAELYGEPTAPLADQASTALELARTFASTLGAATHVALGPPAERAAEHVADVVRRHAARGRRHDPASRVFQALRIAVNDELGHLELGLHAALRALAPGGRLVVLAFQSGEERLVKDAFRAARAEGLGRPLTPKPIRPMEDETRRNPRARPTRLRAFERAPTDPLA